MKKQLLLSTVLAAALSAGSAYAAGGDYGKQATDASGQGMQQQTGQAAETQAEAGEKDTFNLRGTEITPTQESGYEPSRVGVGGVTADRSMQITNNTDAVRGIQQALQEQGADIQVDGIWGPSTQQALMEFQKEQGQAEATGEPDRETLQALDVDLYQQQPQTAETPSDIGQPDRLGAGGDVGQGGTMGTGSISPGSTDATGAGSLGSEGMGSGTMGSGSTGTGGGMGSGSTSGQ